ncbi:MAG: peptide chain release factor 1 [Candidatus Omnitrophota bacterium]
MFKQLERLEKRFQELEELLASQEVISNQEQCNRYARELSELKEPVSLLRQYRRIDREIRELQVALSAKDGQEFLDLAEKEIKDLGAKKAELEAKIKKILAGEDKDIGKNVIMEVRQGTGGMEAGLFVADLYRMYSRYAQAKGWELEPMSISPAELGSIKEVIFSVKGKEAYKRLKFESGVHRVQRVPTTEAQGRIHTSTATVAVLIEPQDVDLVIEPKDLRIDTYRSSGPGGQHMQKSDSAVRITHIPSGVVVACQDERSQLKNKTKAMRILGARLLDIKEQAEIKRISQARKSQIGTGERSEKIRTYNFPDRRITDHRINLTLHKLEAVLEGELDEMSDALIAAAEAAKNE